MTEPRSWRDVNPAEAAHPNEKPKPDEARNDELLTVQVQVCRGCISGTPGECHAPGCFYWLHSIEDVPHDVLFAYVVKS